MDLVRVRSGTMEISLSKFFFSSLWHKYKLHAQRTIITLRPPYILSGRQRRATNHIAERSTTRTSVDRE
jgi:hypothetical protein